MLKIYNTDIDTNKIEKIKEFKKGSWINLVNPSESAIRNDSSKRRFFHNSITEKK